MLFSIMAAPIYIPTFSVHGFFSLHKLVKLVITSLFKDSHSHRCEVTVHSGFDLHFPNDLT